MVVVPDTVEIDIGRLDTQLIELNRWACERIKSPKELVIVGGASHLFKQPGTVE
jgi:putative phosphoribosyl transferase